MKYLLFFLTIGFCIVMKSQTVSGNFSFPNESSTLEVFDKSVQNVYYQLSFYSDPKKERKKKDVICLLQLGEKYSRFGELNNIKYDSVRTSFNHLNVIGAKEMNQLSPFLANWKPILLRDLNQNTLTIQDRVRDTYQYKEEQPVFNWKLEQDIKVILGYTCHKASTVFRGRKYVAWYANDLPINNGPYLFNGLPGLILEIEDTKDNYHFTAIALDKKALDIYLNNDAKIFNVTRDKLRTVQKSYYDNPGFFMGKAYDAEGNAMNVKLKSIPYNPIELE
ncbi:GLPGLI family protein [Chryseobacterium sp. T1]